MNPTVMTTGPGVIIATATASTNCRSVSQWWSLTTPPYRNGTMASPLPKTNAPASPKKTAICTSTGQSTAATTGATAGSWAAKAAATGPPFEIPLGLALTNQVNIPAARNTQANSDSVMIVTAAATR